MASTGVACDLCELGRNLTWVIRTERFTLAVTTDSGEIVNPEVMQDFRDGEEWALCRACELDLLADRQDRIMRRRRQAFMMDTPEAEWQSMDARMQSYALQLLDAMVMAVLSCRDKAWGRAWTPEDQRQAVLAVQRAGHRGRG